MSLVAIFQIKSNNIQQTQQNNKQYIPTFSKSHNFCNTMRSSTTANNSQPLSFVGICSSCTRSCHQSSSNQYEKSHKNAHKVYTLEQINGQIKDHLALTTGQSYDSKLQLIHKFFRDLKSRMGELQKITINQYSKRKLEGSFALQNTNKDKINQYVKCARNFMQGRPKNNTCLDTEMLIDGIGKVERSLQNGWRQYRNVMNSWVGQVRKQFDQIFNRMEGAFKRELNQIDSQKQKQFKIKIEVKGKQQKQRQRQRQRQRKQRDLKDKVALTKSNTTEVITNLKSVPENKQFAIRVTVQKIITYFFKRTSEQVSFIGRDSSGTFNISAKKNPKIQQGNQITIKRCTLGEHKGRKQINAQQDSEIILHEKSENQVRNDGRRDGRRNNYEDRRGDRRDYNEVREPRQYGKVYVIKNQRQIKQDRSDDRRDYEGRRKEDTRDDRRDDRRDNRYDRRDNRDDIRGTQRKEQPVVQVDQQRAIRDTQQQIKPKNIRQQIEQQNYKKIKQIEPDSEDLLLCVKIIQIKVQTKQGLDCVIGDETGIVNAILPASESCVAQDYTILISHANAAVIDNHIKIVLTKNSSIKRSYKKYQKINLGYNASKQQWQQTD